MLKSPDLLFGDYFLPPMVLFILLILGVFLRAADLLLPYMLGDFVMLELFFLGLPAGRFTTLVEYSIVLFCIESPSYEYIEEILPT